jgi:hypothetical protein
MIRGRSLAADHFRARGTRGERLHASANRWSLMRARAVFLYAIGIHFARKRYKQRSLSWTGFSSRARPPALIPAGRSYRDQY